MPINPNNSGIEIVLNDFTPCCLKLNIFFLSVMGNNDLTIFSKFLQELQNSFVFTVKMTKEAVSKSQCPSFSTVFTDLGFSRQNC